MSATIDGVRIVDMPDLGNFNTSSSVVGERAGSGRFGYNGLTTGLSAYFLPLAGGDVTGPTTFSYTVTSPDADVPRLLETTWNVDNASGTNAVIQVQTGNKTYINNAVGQAIWANRDELFYRAPTPSTSFSSYIARAIATLAFSDRGSGPSAPQLWGILLDVEDQTGHPSSVSGNLLSMEIDIGAAGLDDANNRAALVVVGATYGYPTVPSSEFSSGIVVASGDVGATFKSQLNLAGRFNTAGINFTQSVSIGGAPAIWLSTGQSIAFDTGKNMQFLWNGTSSQYEFQWFGTSYLAINPSGDVTVAGTIHARGIATTDLGSSHGGNLSVNGTLTATTLTTTGSASVGGTITARAITTTDTMSHFGNGFSFQGGDASAGSIYTDSNWGCLIHGRHGSTADIGLQASDGITKIQVGTAGIGFNGVVPVARPAVTGAKGGNAALAALLTALAGVGLLTDSTT